ncbi:type II toxin -antitoxin system TacA 1-like antitoxin [Clostridium perfringens]|uniref:type II toxin -antitoxin system TacA 1-like antitoxin n=1 Tax=Clostridium perfringens TaxID=1502 RepID=UPI0018E4A656|nr:DUF1778 domain-containing protein [Clostridium perfringens]MBI5995674.1 DUF1778 domain-containing protein [Clostridium perfringens]MBI6001336.1 DUF1778 domain-containing protein [Clostridium perfringens]MDU7109392.1 DUF1778 domain-containing protein [Clostridium perfringens]
MAKKAVKLEELKIRLTVEEKALIKEAAAFKDITMTQYILDMAVPTARRDIEVVRHKEVVEDRIIAMDSKIEKLKGKMEKRRSHSKKNRLVSLFGRKPTYHK